jgi:hypothetical protein
VGREVAVGVARGTEVVIARVVAVGIRSVAAEYVHADGWPRYRIKTVGRLSASSPPGRLVLAPDSAV